MTTYSEPNPGRYRGDDPDYLRSLVERIGMSQRQIAGKCGIHDSDFRRALSGKWGVPYSVQYMLETMARAARPKPDDISPARKRETLDARIRTHHAGQLAELGARVLELLEDHDEWDADTIDGVANICRDLGLSTLDGRGQFMVAIAPPQTASCTNCNAIETLPECSASSDNRVLCSKCGSHDVEILPGSVADNMTDEQADEAFRR